MQTLDCQEPEPSPLASDNHNGIDSPSHDSLVPIVDDFDQPIARRKGIRGCTDHPIERYVAYGKLLPSYKAFVSNLDSVQVPNSIQEALKVLA